MPSIKNFEKKSGQKTQQRGSVEENSSSNEKSDKVEKSAQNKRRPGRDMEAGAAKADIKVVHVDVENHGEKMETENQNIVNEQAEVKSQPQEQVSEATQTSQKIEINFPGSELIRSRFPQPFAVAEAVATDWVNDGKFDALPLSQPLAKTVAQQGLLKAKEIEKKVMASPTTEKIAMQAFTYAMKAQGLLNEIKSKVNKK